MNELIVALIDRIKDEAIKGATFRLYNNARALIASAYLTLTEYLAYYFVANGYPESFKDLLNADMWETAILVLVLQTLGIASLDKYSRAKRE